MGVMRAWLVGAVGGVLGLVMGVALDSGRAAPPKAAKEASADFGKIYWCAWDAKDPEGLSLCGFNRKHCETLNKPGECRPVEEIYCFRMADKSGTNEALFCTALASTCEKFREMFQISSAVSPTCGSLR